MIDYFFSGKQYVRVTRGQTGPGSVDAGYPAPITNWNWGNFGANGIDAALYSGSKCYFFSGKQYIRVTRGVTGPGTVDPGYPAPISNWNWGTFGANGIDAALYSGSKCYFFSGNRYVRVSRGDTGPGIMDPGYPAPISNWNWGTFGANGIKAALYSGGPYVPAPSAGLGSNSNYFLNSNCTSLTGLSVTINVDVDIVGSDGFGFQVNAYSGKSDYDAAQQYLIYLDPYSSPAQLNCMVDNWLSTGTQLINHIVPLATLPSQKLPAGYQLTITLLNDSSGNVSGATYTAVDNNGKTLGSQTITLLSLNLVSGAKVTTADLAPIVAFQLDFVDYLNGGKTTLSSGEGTITYTASNLMTVLSSEPSCVAWDYITLETANSGYGFLPSNPSQTFTQSFLATAAGAVISKQGSARTVRHKTSRLKPKP
jgi:hypothetical protein